MHLGNVNMLLLLWLAPALVALYLYAAWRRGRAMRVFVEAGLLERISTSVRPGARRLKAALTVAAVAFIALALARPAWNPKPRTVERRGRDIVFVIDVSRSMIAEDLAPNRLGRAKLAVSDMIDRLEGDRVALVAFAGTAVLRCPLTLDYGFFRMMLEDLDTDSVSRGGTMIGDAIRKALDEAFDDQEKKYTDIILITDGEDHDSFPVEAAEEAGKRGVRIIAVGLGDEDQGRRIPVTDENGHRAFLTHDGKEVWSRLDAATLRKMANKTPGGRYLNVATGAVDLGDVYTKLIAGEEKREIESKTITLYEEKFQIFIAVALALLVIELLISERRRRAMLTALVAVIIPALLIPSGASAESPGRLVKKGNRAYRSGEYDAAAQLYDLASVRLPESPVLEFNQGNVLYMKEDFEGARERFQEAALKSRDLLLEALAWYNSGNCAFRQGQRQADSDIEKALSYLREAVDFYSTALEKDPGLADAAHNLEVTRLTIKQLLDRLKEMQEQMKQQQDKLRAVVDSLLSALDRQEDALSEAESLGDAVDRTTPEWKRQLGELAGDQRDISKSTASAAGRLSELFPGEQPDQVRQAAAHLDTAMTAQGDAAGDLGEGSTTDAMPHQRLAADKIRDAVEELTRGEGQQGQQEQQQQQQAGQQQQQQGEEPQQESGDQQVQKDEEHRSETARGIIDQEKENRKKRREQGAEGYRKVDKDW